jgi:hypothetical protein
MNMFHLSSVLCVALCTVFCLSVVSYFVLSTNINHKHKDKITAHPNELATKLLNDEVEPLRLKRFKPADLMKQHIQMLFIHLK